MLNFGRTKFKMRILSRFLSRKDLFIAVTAIGKNEENFIFLATIVH